MYFWSSTLASAFALTLGIASLWMATDGGRAWTAESARRLAVQHEPIEFQPFRIVDADLQHETVGFQDSETPDLLLVEFIFTRCPTVCQSMGAEFSSLQTSLAELPESLNIQLLSISFDPNDGAAELRDYATRYRANPEQWSIAKLDETQKTLRSLERTIGLVVIPDETMGYIHNTAIYAVRGNEVVAIFDYDDRPAIEAWLTQLYADKNDSLESTAS